MTELIPPHHRSLSAHLLLKCWNVSGTSSWRASLSGHSAAGDLMTELRSRPPTQRCCNKKPRKKDAIRINRLNCNETKMKMSKEAVVMDSELVYWAIISKCMKEYVCNITSIIFFLFLTSMPRLISHCIYCLRIYIHSLGISKCGQ